MKLRTFACLIGAIAISSAPFVLAVSGGGFPSQPIFQTLRVSNTGVTVSSTHLADFGTGTRGGGNNFMSFSDSTGVKTDIGFITASDDLYVYNITNNALRLGSNNTDILDLTGTTATLNVTGGNIARKDAANTFTANQTISGASPTQTLNSTSAGAAFVVLQNNGTNKAFFCLSTVANSCTVGDAISDTAIRSDATLWFSTAAGGNQYASLTQAGVLNVKSGGDFQVNGTSVCLSNGVNCGPAGRVTSAWSGTCNGTGCISGVTKNANTPIRNSAGNYTMTPPSAIGSSSVCTVSPFGSVNAGLFMHVSSITATTINILSVNSAGTQTDTNGFSLICMS